MASPKFSEENIERKMQSVSNTQDSVQSLSLWIIHHKSHHKRIVDVWHNVIQKSSPKHKLTLFNVCNDVVQNGKRKHAAVYVETFRDVLKDAIVYVSESQIKSNVERILKIWKDRNIFSSSFVGELQEALASSKIKYQSPVVKESTTKIKDSTPKMKDSTPKMKESTPKVKEATKAKEPVKPTALASPPAKAPKIDKKILAEFKPEKVIDKINTFKRLEGEVELKGKQLSNLKLDASSIEAIKQLKDKAHGKQFSQQFEDSCFKLEDFCTSIEKEIEEQQSMIEVLEQSELFYDEQYREAKIVVNAYKNFGSRINNLKKKLDDLKESLPSPIPSPSYDAPSPGNTPPEDEQIEAIDMDLDEDSQAPSNIIVGSKVRKGTVANTITVKCIPQPIPSVTDIRMQGRAANISVKDGGRKSNSTGFRYMQTINSSKSGDDGEDDALDSRLAKMIPTLNQHHDPRNHENEPAVYNPPPKHSSVMALQAREQGEGTPTKDEGSSTPVMDEKPESPTNKPDSAPSDSSSKTQNPIDFLTQILSKTTKTSQGNSNFFQNLSLLTNTVKTQFQQQRETSSESSSAERAPLNSWAEWKAKRHVSPPTTIPSIEQQASYSQISAPQVPVLQPQVPVLQQTSSTIPSIEQQASYPQISAPQVPVLQQTSSPTQVLPTHNIPTLQSAAQPLHTPVSVPSVSTHQDTSPHVQQIQVPQQSPPVIQHPTSPVSISQIPPPMPTPGMIQSPIRPMLLQPPFQQVATQMPFRLEVPVPPVMPSVQVPVSGWNMPPRLQGFPIPRYIAPVGQVPPSLGSPPWGPPAVTPQTGPPAVSQQPEVKVSTADEEMQNEQDTGDMSQSSVTSPVSNQPKGILRKRNSSLREIPITPDPVEAAREFSAGGDGDSRIMYPRPPAEPPSPSEIGKSKLVRHMSESSENINIVDDHQEFMEKLKRKTTGNSNLIAPPIIDFNEEAKIKQVFSRNPNRPNLTTIMPIDLDSNSENTDEDRVRKNFTELSAEESDEMPIQTIKSIIKKGPQPMETSDSIESKGAPITTINSAAASRNKTDMQGDHAEKDNDDDKKYESRHDRGHDYYRDYHRHEPYGHRDHPDAYRHHRGRPFFDPFQRRDDFFRDRYGAPIPRRFPDFHRGRHYQRY